MYCGSVNGAEVRRGVLLMSNVAYGCLGATTAFDPESGSITPDWLFWSYSSRLRLKNQIGTMAESTMMSMTITKAQPWCCEGSPTFMP